MLFLGRILTIWLVTALALQGVVALTAEFFAIDGGRPRLPMILAVALAIAVWRQLSQLPPRAEPARPDTVAVASPPSPAAGATVGPADHCAAVAPQPPIDSSELVAHIDQSLTLQLQILRQSLDLTGVALLSSSPDGKSWVLRGIDSLRNDIQHGPYPAGIGIIGALDKGQDEIALAPVRTPFCGIPYYPPQTQVGSLLALRIPTSTPGSAAPDPRFAILCVDRDREVPFSDAERGILRLAVRKMSLDGGLQQQLLAMSDECQGIRQICAGMHELNQGLGLEDSFNAAIKALRALVPADFIAISLVQGTSHCALWAEGVHAEQVLGVQFPLNSGLVGQVLKLNRPLPDDGIYNGISPVFDSAHRFADFRSLRILPLRKDGEAATGAVTLAARKPLAFTRNQFDLLELIATQVAIKIDLAQAHEKINHLAITDSLTGLANHRAFMHGFEVMLSRAQRRGTPLALLLCDVDHFKAVNDGYGHPCGDQVLRQVADYFRQNVRMVDLAARYGGEEFAILLEDSDAAGALLMAERLRRQIENSPIRHQQHLIRVTISIGLAVCPADGITITGLIDGADQALYYAKASGRNRTVSWQSLQEDRRRVQKA